MADLLPDDLRLGIRGTRVQYAPPPKWDDAAAGKFGTVVTDPLMNNGNDWMVLVHFDGEKRWRPIDVCFLEMLT